MSDLDSHADDVIGEHALSQWAQAMTHIANHYRVACSPGAIQANAPWFAGKSRATALSQLARQAGLSFHALNTAAQAFGQWRLPVVAELRDGQLMVIEHFNGEDTLDVFIIAEEGQRNRLTIAELLPEIVSITALRPLSALKDSRVDRYFALQARLDARTGVKGHRPPVDCRLLINVLSLAGIIFPCVYDRVIPAQSYPRCMFSLPVFWWRCCLAFCARSAYPHNGSARQRADMRISDRVFSHALRLRNSAVPRSTGSFISQLRELEQVREMITSSTMSTIVDLPFFFLFIVVLACIAPPLAWIAPVAALLMILPCCYRRSWRCSPTRLPMNPPCATLVESVQGLEDIKLMQAENRFLQQWNSYIRITGESGLRTRKLTQGLIGWGMSVQSLVYAAIIMFGAPMVIEGTMTTGAVVAASMLGSRMIAPMANLCGVLARWQQVKAAKMGLDNIMQLPTETQYDEDRVHQEIFHAIICLRTHTFATTVMISAFPLRDLAPGGHARRTGGDPRT
ncbi:ABC transporter transmembrane domain-containing protein [Citrobacter freundii]|uniref:ABC transporter transmembrane domain-containing protein n=1 Tax=Citrobacter freundii TaxID=546 RepID=UPI001EFF5AFA|nr:ABC transporter transmembrane domain-containing protein [Citrobacter freundii]